MDLYDKEPHKLEDNLDNIKKRIEECYEKSVQKKLKIYSNYKRYFNDISNNLVKDAVNQLFHQYIDYLDSTEHTFYASFQGNYGERVFELVMADFINKTFSLEKRTEADKIKNDGSVPDLKFFAQGKTYYLECTTRETTLIPDYISLLAKFDAYFAVAKIFSRKNDQKNYFLYEFQINIWRALNNEEKDFVWKKLGFSGSGSQHTCKEHLDEFNKWVFYQKHVLSHFREILPKKIIDKWNEINLNATISYTIDDQVIFQKFLGRLIAQAVCSKVDKKYFTENVPVILSISLSLIQDFKMIRNPEELINSFKQNFPNIFNEVLQEKLDSCPDLERSKQLKEKFKNGLQNLYAIIVDTTWYNWFPEIAGANMPKGYDNCYGIIYNTSISIKTVENSDQMLFASNIPFQIHCELKID